MRRLDPRARILVILLLFGVPLCFQSPLWLAPIALALLLVLALSGGARMLAAFAPMLLILLTVSVLLWPLFLKGGTPIGGWLTREGVLFGLGMGVRLAAFAFLGMLYLLTSPVEETAWALSRLGLPYVVSFGIVTAFRLMERIGKTAETVVAAQRSRGLTTHTGSPGQRWKSYIPLLVPILVLSMRRVDGMAMAMESRAFSPLARRTSFMDFRMKPADWIALLVVGCLLGAAAWLRMQGFGVMVAGRL